MGIVSKISGCLSLLAALCFYEETDRVLSRGHPGLLSILLASGRLLYYIFVWAPCQLNGDDR